MNIKTDLMIIGAGPVGLLCAYLAKSSGLDVIIIDKSQAPLCVGRADALNARTLQLLEIADVFSELYPLGKPCNTSSVFSEGKFISRQSSWWDTLTGCLHKHFLMLGQSFLEHCLNNKLDVLNTPVKRLMHVKKIDVNAEKCLTTLSDETIVESSYVIAADGAHSFVRNYFKIPFHILKPNIIWAVIDGIIESDFIKVPEIIVFQTKTAEVAWIPREGNIDRFYIRMDKKLFNLEEVIDKIQHALSPYTLSFKEIIWFSHFSVKESLAKKFLIQSRIFLVGDAAHIHSVNGGQGLNTGLGDAFNLIWRLKRVIDYGAPIEQLVAYEKERRPVAQSVIHTSGELVRSTRDSVTNTHAEDYVKLIEKHAGHITGMGIRYGHEGLWGTRVFDFELFHAGIQTRLYSLLDYNQFTLLIFTDDSRKIKIPSYLTDKKQGESTQIIVVLLNEHPEYYWTKSAPYKEQVILVRPDAYIAACELLLNPFILGDHS